MPASTARPMARCRPAPRSAPPSRLGPNAPPAARAGPIAGATAPPPPMTMASTQRTGTSVAPGAAPTMASEARLTTVLDVPVPWPGLPIDAASGSTGGPPPARMSVPLARSSAPSSSRWSATPVSGWPIRIPSPVVPKAAQARSAFTAETAQRSFDGAGAFDLQIFHTMPPTDSAALRPSSSSAIQPGSTSGTQDFRLHSSTRFCATSNRNAADCCRSTPGNCNTWMSGSSPGGSGKKAKRLLPMMAASFAFSAWGEGAAGYSRVKRTIPGVSFSEAGSSVAAAAARRNSRRAFSM